RRRAKESFRPADAGRLDGRFKTAHGESESGNSNVGGLSGWRGLESTGLWAAPGVRRPPTCADRVAVPAIQNGPPTSRRAGQASLNQHNRTYRGEPSIHYRMASALEKAHRNVVGLRLPVGSRKRGRVLVYSSKKVGRLA